MLDGTTITNAITEAFREQPHAVGYALTRKLGAVFPGCYVLETDEHGFDLGRFAEAKHCKVVPVVGTACQVTWHWRHHAYPHTWIGAWSIEWPGASGAPMYCVAVTWGAGDCTKTVRYIVAPRHDQAEALFAAVCRWNDDLAGSVLVFDRGSWHKVRALRADIDRTRPEDLVLPARQRDEILGDLQRFLDRRAEYERLGVPWKRGVLLSGPPGNGKTMCIKLLANALRVPGAGEERRPIDPLYVRSLAVRGWPDHYTIDAVFERARRHTPCLLIFEDLDALVTDKNRSVFLNELDGLAMNSGIIVVATTNHAERLDPALRDRPSRFDRKWHFALPALPERQRFLAQWNERADPSLQLAVEAHARIAELTDGFSFAYLKELMVSSTMRWIDDTTREPLADTVLRQIGQLREQMSENVQPPAAMRPAEPDDDEDD